MRFRGNGTMGVGDISKKGAGMCCAGVCKKLTRAVPFFIAFVDFRWAGGRGNKLSGERSFSREGLTTNGGRRC